MNTAKTLESPREAPNLFWPVVLIGAGVVILMSNLGMLLHNPVVLLPFWPVLLIVAGIEIIFARTGVLGTLVSAALGLAVVLGALWYLNLPGQPIVPAWFNWNWNW